MLAASLARLDRGDDNAARIRTMVRMGRVEDCDGSRGYARGGPRRAIKLFRTVLDYTPSGPYRSRQPVHGVKVYVSGVLVGYSLGRSPNDWTARRLVMAGPDGSAWARLVPMAFDKGNYVREDEEKTEERMRLAIAYFLGGDVTGWDRIETGPNWHHSS